MLLSEFIYLNQRGFLFIQFLLQVIYAHFLSMLIPNFNSPELKKGVKIFNT